MKFTDKSLQFLARQLGERNLANRAELEAKVAPLICLVLRTGQGYPSLVQWVKRALHCLVPSPSLPGGVDPEWAAPRLARLLCSDLLRTNRLHRNTVIRPETLVSH